MNSTPSTPSTYALNAAPNAPNGKSGKYRQRPDMNGIKLFSDVPQAPRKKPRIEGDFDIVPLDGINLNFDDSDSDSDSEIDNFVWNPEDEINVEDCKFSPENLINTELK